MIPLLILASALAWGQDARISTSQGEAGGVVVLWPRVIPASEDATIRQAAALVQQRLVGLARTTLPGKAIDVRPEPQRVCPQAGCAGVSIGAVLLNKDQGCAVVAWASVAGRSNANMAPWAGKLQLKASNLPFRELPEDYVTVVDFSSCSDLSQELYQRQGPIESVIKAVGKADASVRGTAE